MPRRSSAATASTVARSSRRTTDSHVPSSATMLGVAARPGRVEQRVGRLHQQALRGSGRALGHALILATTTDKTGPSTASPAKIL